MNGKYFLVRPDENSAAIGWEIIKANQSRLKPFDFEESSIDLSALCRPKVVVKDDVWGDLSCDIIGQYFQQDEKGEVNRIVLLKPLFEEKENAELSKQYKKVRRYGTGVLPGMKFNPNEFDKNLYDKEQAIYNSVKTYSSWDEALGKKDEEKPEGSEDEKSDDETSGGSKTL